MAPRLRLKKKTVFSTFQYFVKYFDNSADRASECAGCLRLLHTFEIYWRTGSSDPGPQQKRSAVHPEMLIRWPWPSLFLFPRKAICSHTGKITKDRVLITCSTRRTCTDHWFPTMTRVAGKRRGSAKTLITRPFAQSGTSLWRWHLHISCELWIVPTFILQFSLESSATWGACSYSYIGQRRRQPTPKSLVVKYNGRTRDQGGEQWHDDINCSDAIYKSASHVAATEERVFELQH